MENQLIRTLTNARPNYDYEFYYEDFKASQKDREKVESTLKGPYFVILLEADRNSRHIPIIRIIREYTNLGLRESKDLIDVTPSIIKRNIGRYEAEQLVIKLTQYGARTLLCAV
jgi:large subunit ribosomal protein L7/L12